MSISEISYHLESAVELLASSRNGLKDRLKESWNEHLSRILHIKKSMPGDLSDIYNKCINELSAKGATQYIDTGEIAEDVIARTLKSMRYKKVSKIVKMICRMSILATEYRLKEENSD